MATGPEHAVGPTDSGDPNGGDHFNFRLYGTQDRKSQLKAAENRPLN